MSREIKFRAWDKRNNQMLQDVSIGTIKIWDDVGGKKEALSNDCVFMQFTGLLDKNGKEIYEGDVVSDTKYKHIVIYDLKNVGFVLEELEKKIIRNFLHSIITYEVIGNIFESPDLLKGEK